MANTADSEEDSLSKVVVGKYGVLYAKPFQRSVGPRVVDLRSDTVTKPTEEMRVAMFEAEVGDDVFEEDPTVGLLETTAARMLGKEAALFVSSGTMGNLIAVMSHCWGRGEEVLLGDMSHMTIFEQGGIAQIANVHPRCVRTLPDGTLDLAELEGKIMPDDVHFTTARLVVVENSHNLRGGRPIRPEYMERLAQLISGKGIKIHVDGARLFNAATALGVPAARLVEHADSVSVCLSKGLGAPAGSVLAGSADFIARGRRVRKVLGGGMRQVGVLAAPGLIALEKMSQRLQIDHNMAQILAKGLQGMAHLGISIDPQTVETNIVMFELVRADMSTDVFLKRLSTEEGGEEEEEGGVVVKMMPFRATQVRAVLHHQVNREQVDLALAEVRRVLETYS